MVKNNIPKDVCKNIIKKLNNEKWYKHAWYNYADNKTNNLGDKEFDTNWSDLSHNILEPYIIKTIKEYEKFTNQKTILCSRFSRIPTNRDHGFIKTSFCCMCSW